MALVVMGLGLVNRVYFETRFLRELESELEWRSLGVAAQVAREALDLSPFRDSLSLHRLLLSARDSTPDFAYAFVLDRQGQLLVHTFDSDFPAGLRFLLQPQPQRLVDETSVQRVELGGAVYRDIAVALRSGEVGVLHLGVSDARLLARVAVIRRELWFIVLTAMLLGSLAAYVLTFVALEPVAAIAKSLHRFEPGRHREEIPVTRLDEIGELATKVNEVTERLDETYRRLAHTEKMVSVGIMASGIAHEINNPITGIQNCLRRIQAEPSDTEQTTEYVGVMLQATQHIEAVVRGLLDFSRSSGHRTMPVDLRETVGRALDLVNLRLCNRQVSLRREEPDDPVMVLGDAVQLTQVVINLVINASDAMSHGGELLIRIVVEPNAVLLQVRDHGMGIAAADLQRVFDPFFTTKDVGQGTGLGLAVTHGIVTDHHGTISIESIVGEGTQVSVRLPLYNQRGEP